MIITDINLQNLHKSIENTIVECSTCYKILIQQKNLEKIEVENNLNEFFNSLKDTNYTLFNEQVEKINTLINEVKNTKTEIEKPSSKVLSLADKKVFANNLQIFKNQLVFLFSISEASFKIFTQDFIIYDEKIGRFPKVKLLQKKDKTPLTLDEIYDLGDEIIKEIQKAISQIAGNYIKK